MTTNIWTGGANDNNWGTAGNWSQGHIPAATEDIQINDVNVRIDSGLDQHTVTVASITLAGGVSIGSDTTPLKIGCSGSVRWTGSGSVLRIFAGDDGIAKIMCSPKSNGTAFISGGTFTQVEGAAGQVNIDSAAVVTHLKGCGAGIIAGYNATGFTTLLLTKGVCYTKRSHATSNVGPGALLVSQLAAAVTTSVTVWPSGTYTHQSSGTIALSDVKTDGKANAAGNPFSGFTITNRTQEAGFKENFDTNESVSITFTNGATVIGYLGPLGTA